MIVATVFHAVITCTSIVINIIIIAITIMAIITTVLFFFLLPALRPLNPTPPQLDRTVNRALPPSFLQLALFQLKPAATVSSNQANRALPTSLPHYCRGSSDCNTTQGTPHPHHPSSPLPPVNASQTKRSLLNDGAKTANTHTHRKTLPGARAREQTHTYTRSSRGRTVHTPLTHTRARALPQHVCDAP